MCPEKTLYGCWRVQTLSYAVSRHIGRDTGPMPIPGSSELGFSFRPSRLVCYNNISLDIQSSVSFQYVVFGKEYNNVYQALLIFACLRSNSGQFVLQDKPAT
jgi:hypothetical protein